MRQIALTACLGASLLVTGIFAAGKSRTGEAKTGDAAKGKAVFEQQCVMCHNATSTEKKMGPGLKGLFRKDKLANGNKATEQNIRAQVENGGNSMPAYKDMLSDAERTDLLAYLHTL